MKEFVTTEMATMVEEALYGALRNTCPIAHRVIRSDVYNVAERIMLDRLCKEVIGETLDAHITRFLDTAESPESIWKRLWTSTSLMEPIAAFVRRIMVTALQDKAFSTAVVPRELVGTIPTFDDECESPLSTPDSRSEQYP